MAAVLGSLTTGDTRSLKPLDRRNGSHIRAFLIKIPCPAPTPPTPNVGKAGEPIIISSKYTYRRQKVRSVYVEDSGVITITFEHHFLPHKKMRAR